MAREKMRAKFTLLMCALLMPGLAVTRANAQDGYLVSRDISTVVQHGKNQRVGDIQLEYSEDGGTIDAGETITIAFGGLPIAVIGTVTCSGGTCNEELKKDDAEDPAGTAIAIAVSGQSDGNTILVSGARVDVSGLDAGDEIIATISSSAPTGLIPVGQARRQSVSAAVAEVKAGLAVEITQAGRLLCNLDATEDLNDPPTPGDPSDDTPVGGVPAIGLTEGFASAWEEVLGGTRITIETNNLPAGVTLRWPAEVEFLDPEDPKTDVWSQLTLETTKAQAGHADEDADNDGSEVVYAYTIEAAGTPTGDDSKAEGVADFFKIEPAVTVEASKVRTGGVADIRAWLSPQPADKDADINTVLSYLKMPVTDPKATGPDGGIINFSECVTYLLFPYLNCGAYPSWDTRIAIANTSMDDGVFGLSRGAVEQSGSVVLHGFPRSIPTFDGSSGQVPASMTVEVTSSLAAGDTVSFNCSEGMLAGFEGYAIARAGFRHAHGMAFIRINFMQGASVDIAHSYLALVIPDPEFGGQRPPASGESLGH